jgi:hypothetical protein
VVTDGERGYQSVLRGSIPEAGDEWGRGGVSDGLVHAEAMFLEERLCVR